MNVFGVIKGVSVGEVCVYLVFMFDICVVCGERRATEDARGGVV